MSRVALHESLIDGVTTNDETIDMLVERQGGKKGKSIPALLLSSPLVSMNFAEANRRTATRLEAVVMLYQLMAR